jgi:hypothetical protein
MDAPHPQEQRSTPGRNSWPRFALAATLSASAACALVFATATAALPASLALSGPAFQVSADRLEGTGFVQFAPDRSERRRWDGRSGRRVRDRLGPHVVKVPPAPLNTLFRRPTGDPDAQRCRD